MFICFRQHNVHSTRYSHKGLSRFCFFVFCFVFCFVSFCCCFCCCLLLLLLLLFFFFLPERIKMLQASPASPHRSISHTVLSLFFVLFSVREDENMLHTSLATQAFRHIGLITTQDYFLTGLFRHRFIRHMGPLYAFFYHTGLFHWQGQNITRLNCHKELSSTQVCCML